MLCAIWYHLYNLKNVKNTHGGVILLVKLQFCFTKSNTPSSVFSRFLNCANGAKSRNLFIGKLIASDKFILDTVLK